MKTLERTSPRAASDGREPLGAPGRSGAQPARPAPDLDNQMLQALLAGGALRAKLRVGAPDDPAEAEADRMADAALAGKPAGCHCAPGQPPCSSCQAAALLRKPRRPGPAPEAPSGLSLGSERRLGAAERKLFESRYGADLSGVRIHDNPEAASSAGKLDARAFSIGRSIAFGAGQYRPETDEGRRLLGHELAHVVRGHGDVRRDPVETETPPPPKPADPKAAGDFDPCALDVSKLDNHQLLVHFALAEKYVTELLAAKRKGEERFYDYGNLLERLTVERSKRALSGHVWLKTDLTDVPGVLWRLEGAPLGSAILVTPGDTKGAAANQPLGRGILLTDGQFNTFLEKQKIPKVDPATWFAEQAPGENKPLQLQPPAPDVQTTPADPYGLLAWSAEQEQPPLFDDPTKPYGGFGPWGVLTPQTAQAAKRYNAYLNPVVTAGPYNYNAKSVEGFESAWRGAYGEARFLSKDAAKPNALTDVNQWHPNFDLFDAYDPVSGELISVKTQLPQVAGDAPNTESVHNAWRELFGGQDPAKRARALQRLQAQLGPGLTQEQMLLSARIAVNPEHLVDFQDGLETAIRGGQGDYYAPILDALLGQQPVTVQLKDGSSKTYSDFASLRADFDADPRRMAKQRFRAAVAELAQRARNQIIPNASSGEVDLRPALDTRKRFDFTGAAEFAGAPDTAAAKQSNVTLQRKFFERISTPELADIQAKGYGPTVGKSMLAGGGAGVGITALLHAPSTINNWDTDQYAGYRYLRDVGMSGAGNALQSGGEQAWRAYISQRGLDWAASRAASGGSVAPLSRAIPLARFGGSTALGGIASGGITLGSMYLDERYFEADYSRIDYTAKGTRAFVSGTGAAGVGAAGGALATALTVAAVGGTGGAAGCTVVLPVVGTVGCGAVGAAGGFIVGLGAYYLIDYTVGEQVEAGVRESMGEKGCTGKAAVPATPSAPQVHGCFAADTPVLLADGRRVAIAELAIGDLVLSWHERARRLESRPVLALHGMAPAAMLELRFADGARVQVTPSHKLRTPDGWVAAADLRPGDRVHSAHAGAAALDASALLAVLPAPPCGSVYDLSVQATHTYFAAGLLAHNKVF